MMSDNFVPKAIIFDMDGVLLDSETICDKAWARAGAELGISEERIKEAITACRGCSTSDTHQILRTFFGCDFDSPSFTNRCSHIFMETEFSTGIPLMPYAKEILEYLKPKYRIALASSTRGPTVNRQIKGVGLYSYFETFTTGDMVTHSKPEPEIYLMACKSLNLEPSQCIAVEDSPNGVRSAAAAGIKCIMIPDKIQPDGELKALAWKIFSSLEDLKEIL